MVIWFFENHQFTNAWIPFDRINQKKLEYVYRHHEEIITYIKQHPQEDTILLPPVMTEGIDLEEEDPSIHAHIQYSMNCIYIILKDSHFEQPIILYPILQLGSLPNRDILILRTDIMDHRNKCLFG